ncbi:hypothetical protein CEJ51_06240 [Escherichia coli]|uniref:D-alanyl-D-alanine carboxypeptidase family protein n=2 Tax=Escherichia coli TaxID=562 RepID=UPI000BA54E2F|nr:D-alanyl-D-alanine carboxypeptidase family protein [Escherichia coli]PAL38462.1 hypothetical protein CEJ52_11075 [Escherichia coli]PAL41970.1 hypothetical protein CEJ51_06240 [Escherichia coli]
MFIGTSKLARKASPNKDISSTLYKALTSSTLVNKQLLDNLKQQFKTSIKSGNEQIVVLLQNQVRAVERALSLKETEGTQLARNYQKGTKIDSEQYRKIEQYIDEMSKLQAGLSGALKTNLSELANNVKELVNANASDNTKLTGSRELVKALSNSGLFDHSDNFKELSEFLRTQSSLNEDSREYLKHLVDAMNSELQTVDKLNDLVKIAQDSNASEKQQIMALTGISSSLNTGTKFWANLDGLQDILNSTENIGTKVDKLRPLLKDVGDNSMKTRTLYTLQQIEYGLEKFNKGDMFAKIPEQFKKLQKGYGKAKDRVAEKGSSSHGVLGSLVSLIPGLNILDDITGGAISNKADQLGDVATGWAGGKIAEKWRNRGGRNNGSRTRGTNRITSRAGGNNSRANRARFGSARNTGHTFNPSARAGGLPRPGKRGFAGGRGGKAGLITKMLGAGMMGYGMFGGNAQAADDYDDYAPYGIGDMATDMAMDTVLERGEQRLAQTTATKAESAIAGKAGTAVATKASRPLANVASKGLGKAGVGMLGKAGGSLLAKAGGPLATVAMGAFQYANAENQAERNDAIGGTGGALAGAAAGAAIGSIIPGVGTVIGGVIGGIIGGLGGSAAAGWFSDPQDEIPDSVTKQGDIASAIYIDDMIKSGQYDAEDCVELRDYQKKLITNKAIKEYIDVAAGGSTDRLKELINTPDMMQNHPLVYSELINYVNGNRPTEKDSSILGTIGSIAAAATPIGAAFSIGKSLFGDDDEVQIKSPGKDVTQDMTNMPDKDKKELNKLVDKGMDIAEKTPSSAGQLTEKLMGWMGKVTPTGIFPMLTLGVNAFDAVSGGAATGLFDGIKNFFGFGSSGTENNSGGNSNNASSGAGVGMYGTAGNVPGGVMPYPIQLPKIKNPDIIPALNNNIAMSDAARNARNARGGTINGIRNNNFGNIDFRGQAGATIGDGGRFARWGTPEEGMRALGNQLGLYFNGTSKAVAGKQTTVAQIISAWAPPNENNTAKYIQSVCNSMSKGLGKTILPNTQLDLMSDPAQMRELVKAITYQENGKSMEELGYNDAFIDKALGKYSFEKRKFEGQFNESTLSQVNANRTSMGLSPASVTDQYSNTKTAGANVTVTSQPGSSNTAGTGLPQQVANIAVATGPVPSVGGSSGSMANITGEGASKLGGLNNNMRNNLLGMAAEFQAKTGRPLKINEGFRSYQEQLHLYNTKPPGMAARPGRSMHEFGYAVDITKNDANLLAKTGLLDKYGFCRPVSGEPWHVEPKSIQKAGIKEAIRANKPSDVPDLTNGSGSNAPIPADESNQAGDPNVPLPGETGNVSNQAASGTSTASETIGMGGNTGTTPLGTDITTAPQAVAAAMGESIPQPTSDAAGKDITTAPQVIAAAIAEGESGVTNTASGVSNIPSNMTVATPTSGLMSGPSIQTTPMTLPTAQNISNNVTQSAPPIVNQSPQVGSPSTGANSSVTAPMHIDDYGLVFANKLLWDR